MNKVLEYMIKEGTVPSDGTFTVTKSMINRYFDVYRKVHLSKNCKLKNGNIKYAKKLAGLTLMKLNISRSENIEYAPFGES